MADEVILGSGKLYLADFAGGAIPDDASIEVDANNVGRIKGGASLEYKPTEYEITDDDNNVVKRFITKEEVTFKSGVLTWNLKTMSRLSAGTYTDDTTKFIRTLKIGGKTSLKSQLARFVHAKDDGKKLRVTLVATASSGFTLQFNPDKETVVDAVLKALSQDDGTLVIISEEYTAAS